MKISKKSILCIPCIILFTACGSKKNNDYESLMEQNNRYYEARDQERRERESADRLNRQNLRDQEQRDRELADELKLRKDIESKYDVMNDYYGNAKVILNTCEGKYKEAEFIKEKLNELQEFKSKIVAITTEVEKLYAKKLESDPEKKTIIITNKEKRLEAINSMINTIKTNQSNEYLKSLAPTEEKLKTMLDDSKNILTESNNLKNIDLKFNQEDVEQIDKLINNLTKNLPILDKTKKERENVKNLLPIEVSEDKDLDATKSLADIEKLYESILSNNSTIKKNLEQFSLDMIGKFHDKITTCLSKLNFMFEMDNGEVFHISNGYTEVKSVDDIEGVDTDYENVIKPAKNIDKLKAFMVKFQAAKKQIEQLRDYSTNAKNKIAKLDLDNSNKIDRIFNKHSGVIATLDNTVQKIQEYINAHPEPKK